MPNPISMSKPASYRDGLPLSAFCLLITDYFLFNHFSNSITTNTTTPPAIAMDKSHRLSAFTPKNSAKNGTYNTVNCNPTTSADMPASNGLLMMRNLKNESVAEREAQA